MLKKKEAILNLRNGYKFKVLDKDAMLPTIEEVWIKKVYGELDILRDITKPVVIDVGANIGCFSLFAWSKNKESQIFAIEPEKNNFQILQDNIALNDASVKIFSFNLAMSSESGVKKLYLDKETNSGKNSFFGSGRYAEVNCISLENFFIDRNISHCDLLKWT